jgi:ATP-dependent DNA helicase RecG
LSLSAILKTAEGKALECKEAKADFHIEDAVKYGIALANEGGGQLVLGVSDRLPRKIVGTRAFTDVPHFEKELRTRLQLRVEAKEFLDPAGRVIIVNIPSRPIGTPLHHNGRYLCRNGDSLVPMTADHLQRIFDEATPDFSAEVCPGAKLEHLEPAAIEEFRKRWVRRTGNGQLSKLAPRQLLEDAELIVGNHPTNAAMVLLGSHKALGRFMGQCEIIYEWRSQESSIAAQKREEFREGFLLSMDRLWQLVNDRNENHSYQDGLFRYEIPVFSEASVREALLNAVAHRDYRLSGSIFLKQFPRKLVVVSPGGFPTGITPDNILEKQNPRNRRIAEALSKCGLVERSGQGFDRIIGDAIRQGKPLPDFTGSDAWQVSLTLWGEIQDPRFLVFLEHIGSERLESFTPQDLLILDFLRRERPLPARLSSRLPRLEEWGVIERTGTGRAGKYMLSRALYEHLGQKGAYTRKKGLDHGTNKALLLQHMKESLPNGCPISELNQVLPHLSQKSLRGFLKELQEEGRAYLKGSRRWALWFATRLDSKANPGT